METEGEYICMPCLKYSHSDKVPVNLRTYARGGYGIFKKLDSSRLINKERRNNIKEHFANPLHTWCETCENIREDSARSSAFNN